jgi:MoxR-like ATPase
MSASSAPPSDRRQAAREQADRFREVFSGLRRQVQRVFVGHDDLVDNVIAALLAGGHVLIEGVPGLGKTLLVRTLAAAVDVPFSRIQFTPDLMPSDVSGTMALYDKPEGGHELRFEPGPLIASIVLADEINRATPKTQSALLEAMQEHQVSVARQTIRLPEPFMVLATQNPVEQEGTYPLPEAQLDRFLVKLLVSYPSESEYLAIARRTTGTDSTMIDPATTGPEIMQLRDVVRQVEISDPVTRYAARLVMATQPGSTVAPPRIARDVALGSSPRGLQALVLLGKVRALLDQRFAVSCRDIRDVALPALRHRLLLSFEAQAGRVQPDDVLRDVISAVQDSSGV